VLVGVLVVDDRCRRMRPDVDGGSDAAVVTRRRWRGRDGGWASSMVVVVVVRECLFVDDAQIERRQTPTLDLDVVGHSTDSVDSVPVEFRRG
jgi:hypothetical protein